MAVKIYFYYVIIRELCYVFGKDLILPSTSANSVRKPIPFWHPFVAAQRLEHTKNQKQVERTIHALDST